MLCFAFSSTFWISLLVEDKLFDCLMHSLEWPRAYWIWEISSEARLEFWSPLCSRKIRVFLIDVALGSEKSTMS